MSANSPVTLCVARSPALASRSQDPKSPQVRLAGIAWPDAFTLAKLTGLVQSKNHRFLLRREEQAGLEELRQGPTILIGAFNDNWTLRLMDTGRFTFQKDGPRLWIGDKQNPESRQWSISLDRFDADGRPILNQDYAVISRLMHPRTGTMVITVGGLWGFGTEAAGEFVTNPVYLEQAMAHAPANWETQNLQIVVGTEVIDNNIGPPRVLATQCWQASESASSNTR